LDGSGSTVLSEKSIGAKSSSVAMVEVEQATERFAPADAPIGEPRQPRQRLSEQPVAIVEISQITALTSQTVTESDDAATKHRGRLRP
jgi:hypothetical protein